MIVSRFPILFLFFVSGATSLTFEVLWERSLRLAFGVSTYSVAIATAAFMAGLTIGYSAGRGRRLASLPPLAIYAFAELGVAAWALLFPLLSSAADSLHFAAGGSLVIRSVLSFALLLPPTILMGVTLPVVARGLAFGLSGTDPAGRAAASLFAANTLGGVFGCLAASWYGIRLLGATGTSWVAVAANLGIALAAFALARSSAVEADGTTGPIDAPAPSPARGKAVPVVVLAAASFLAGLQTMGLQVVWNRTLVCVVENNTTSFALILSAVLIGSAFGAAVYSPLARRFATSTRRRVAFLVAAEAVLGLWVIASISILNRLYDLAGICSEAVTIDGPLPLLLVRLVLALAPVLPAAAAGAFLLPLLIDLVGGERDAARPVSIVFAADALGSVVGALLAGFVLLPGIGLEWSLVLFALLALATGALVLVATPPTERSLAAGLGTLALVSLAAFVLREPLTLTRWYDGHQKIRGDLKYYKEGTFGTISVFEVEGRKELLINCIEEVPNHRDALVLFKILGHTPVLLHGAAEQVLVNAIGGGITLGSVLHHPVEVDAVDLVPEVVDAMELFAEENDDARSKTNWRLIHDDGRNYLRLTDRHYDVVTADATHPAAGESWPLYTREYYELVKSHLTERGIFAQWLPMHNLSTADFRSVLATFREVYPHLALLFVNRYCVVLASSAPLDFDPATITKRIAANPAVSQDLREFDIVRGEDLLKYVVLAQDGIERLAEGAPIQTDDLASVEFAELDRLGLPETFLSNLEMLAQAIDPKSLARATGAPEALYVARRELLQAQLLSRTPSIDSAFQALGKLQTARATWPGDSDVDYAIATLEGTILQFVAQNYAELLARPDVERYVDVLVGLRNARAEDPFLNQVVGAAYLRLERWENALPYLEKAAELSPKDPNFLSNLAVVYDRLGRYDDALGLLDRVQILMPDNRAVTIFRADVEKRRAGGTTP